MPRNTNLTPDVQAQIARYVNAGAPIPHACVAAGVPWPTCKDWLRKGREGLEPYAEFVDVVNQAKAAWATGSVMRITKASDKDWKAAAWLLERRSAKYYGPKSKVELDHEHNHRFSGKSPETMSIAEMQAESMRLAADAMAATGSRLSERDPEDGNAK